jgi:hypothetical protein
MATGYEGKVKKILHFIFENEVYSWTMACTTNPRQKKPTN